MKKLKQLFVCFIMLIIVMPSITVKADTVPEEVLRTKPQIIIESYQIIEGDLMPGSEGTLSLTFKNTSKTVDAYELVATYVSANSAIYPIYGDSNQIYVGDIGALESVDVEVPFMISDNVVSAAAMSFSMEYRGMNTQLYNNNVSIYIPISTRGVLEINNMSLAKTTTVGAKTMLSINYGNLGDETIYNAVMHVSGDIGSEQQELVLGTIEPGAVVYQDFYVTFKTKGNQQISIDFTFEDKEGNQYNLEKRKLVTTVTEATVDENQMVTPETNTQGQINLSIVFMAAGIAILVILFLFGISQMILRRKKSRGRK